MKLRAQWKKKGGGHAGLGAMLLAWVLGVATIFPQEVRPRYLVDSWQIDEGLPQNSVTSMVQSRDGYLWLGTFNGLVRFDGVRFTVYNSHNTPALDSSRIVRVWEDAGGVLWIGTESGGITRRERGAFIPLPMPKGVQTSQPLNFCDGEASGEVWLTLGSGRLLHFANNETEELHDAWGLANVTPLAPLSDKGRLTLFTDHGMYYRRDSIFVPVSGDAPKYPNNGDVLARARGGGWWRTSEGRIVKFEDDRVVRDVGAVADLNAPVAVLFEDRADSLWIGAAGTGAVRVDPDGSREVIGDQYGLGHTHVRSILEDTEGNIWLGTDGSGLFRLRRGAFSVIDKRGGLGSDVALAVVEDEDGLWIGTNGGGLTHLGRDGPRTFLSPNNLAIVHVWNLLRDHEGTLWIGTWGGGLFRRRNGRFEEVPELSFPSGVVLASYEAPNGALWFGGQDGLVCWHKGRMHRYTTANGLSHNDVRVIIGDGAGGLWIGTNGGGLNHFKDGKFTALRRAQGLADDSIWSLYRDSENTLWIGSFGGGLGCLRNDHITSFSTEDGLPSSVICSITEVDDYLWLTSYNGIFRLKKSDLHGPSRVSGQKLECNVFTKSDGIPSRECTGSFQPAACKTRDGRLVFPTVKGVAIVDPKTIAARPAPLPVIIEEGEFGGATVPLANASSIVIPAGQQQIQFRYTGLNFSAPEKVRFRYKLIGLDKDWQDAGARRTAYYSHLPPGDYTFHVIASNNEGVWNRVGSILAVRVTPAFWQTWWFLAACVVLVGSAITGAVRYVEVRQLQRRMELLEQQHALEKERSRIAKDIHDDLGASLTQITLLSELARTDLPRPAEAESHIRQISTTARDLTRSMDEIVWAVNPQNDSLEDLLTYSVKFAQEHLRLARIRCRVDAPANLPALHLSADIRHNLFLAIKEAINNVAKHSKATEAWLRLRSDEDGFTIEIEDDGQGIPPAALNGHPENLATPGSHNGLRNMQRRLREIGGAFEAKKSKTGGALIRFQLPSLPS